MTANVEWFDYQQEAIDAFASLEAPARFCLYHRTGAGKSLAALGCMAEIGVQDVLVLCPPITSDAWHKSADLLGIRIETISHAKYRQKTFKVSRNQAVIVDEFHLLGGHGASGWTKFDRMCASLQAPVIIASATPNYNDAERVYCIQHALDPASCRGGFLQFLYENCETRANPFSQTPLVDGFKSGLSAADYLTQLPYVHYLEDNVSYTIKDIFIPMWKDPYFDECGLIVEEMKFVSSLMEAKIVRNMRSLTNVDLTTPSVAASAALHTLLQDPSRLMIFSKSSKLATMLANYLSLFKLEEGQEPALITGATKPTDRRKELERFIDGTTSILIGTAALATGLDGLDKVCDRILLYDDTDDASLRRQVIGRIMPRGADIDASVKKVYRFLVG